MKKISYLLLVLVLFFTVTINVFADTYKTGDLIPVNTKGTVETDKFNYNNFVYNTVVDQKGNATLSFESIHNNTLSKTAVSINVLLFDEQQKNIGFLTYCTDKDVSSNNAGLKISANQTIPFSISVTKRYFAEGKLPKDVRFLAVMDENKYCQIGGYSKYAGLTMEEIINGSKADNSQKISIPKIDTKLMGILIPILIAVFSFIITGLLINALHKRIFSKGTVLAYLPITNFYTEMKVIFGSFIAKILLVLYFVAMMLYMIKINIGMILIAVLSGLGLIIIIIKLITGNNEMLFFSLRDSGGNLFKNKKDDEEKTVDLSYDDVSDKPLDLTSFEDNISSGGIEDSKDTVESSNEEKETSTFEDLYKSLDETVVEDYSPQEDNSSINDLYNSIDDNEEKEAEKPLSDISIDTSTDPTDDLYNSINDDEDNEFDDE